MKTSISQLGAIILLVTFVLVSFPVLFAHADVRASLRTMTRLDVPTIVAPITPLVVEPQAPAGGITSSTNGSVNTGGNQGGNVVTGDEHVDVHEVNIGPVNVAPPPSTDSEGSAPVPQTCVNDRRSSVPCPTTPSRTR